MIVFIAGTDTECGKTHLSALFLKALLEMGVDARYQKWVSTGNGKFSDDAHFVYKVAGLTHPPMANSLETPYCFSTPASPHIASELDGKTIDIDQMIQCSRTLKTQCDILIIEGVGGLMVPISRDVLLVDIIERVSIPVILVARAGVGTINHTLLSVESLQNRNIDIRGIILNEDRPTDGLIAKDNMKIIKKFAKIENIIHFGHYPSIDSALPNEVKDASKMLFFR